MKRLIQKGLIEPVRGVKKAMIKRIENARLSQIVAVKTESRASQRPSLPPSNPLVFSPYQDPSAKALTLFRIRLCAPYIYSLLYSNASNQ